MGKLHWEILDGERNKILPLFSCFKDDFYLAGGTALALQLGHRDSIDFDFFAKKNFSSLELFNKLKVAFNGFEIVKVQEEKDTLTVLVDGKIKVSFFAYPYILIKPIIKSEFINLASIEDIGLMKLSAITGRSVLKDYVDLYWILQKISLADLVPLCQKKYKDLDINVVLKSLVYFDDVIEEPMIYKNSGEVSFEEIKNFLRKTVDSYLN
jgi:predicted nucleotidyltransferase component of viral defense system